MAQLATFHRLRAKRRTKGHASADLALVTAIMELIAVTDQFLVDFQGDGGILLTKVQAIALQRATKHLVFETIWRVTSECVCVCLRNEMCECVGWATEHGEKCQKFTADGEFE